MGYVIQWSSEAHSYVFEQKSEVHGGKKKQPLAFQVMIQLMVAISVSVISF